MNKLNLKNVVWKEGKYYVSWNLNTGVSSFGKDRKDAIRNLEEALELYFEDVSSSEISKVERPDIFSSVIKYA